MSSSMSQKSLSPTTTLRRPALARFMVVTHYAYLTVKMSGPAGPISMPAETGSAVSYAAVILRENVGAAFLHAGDLEAVHRLIDPVTRTRPTRKHPILLLSWSPFVNYCLRLATSGISIVALLTQRIALYSGELAPHVALGE